MDHLLCSGVSQRRAAKLLHCNRKTVVRKLIHLAKQKRLQASALVSAALGGDRVAKVIFDEMETSHHTKLKPLSIPLAVSPERVILGFDVAIMPAKGQIAAISRKKYGPRPDHRKVALRRVMREILPHISCTPQFLSDECPRYPKIVQQVFPGAPHQTVKSRRACVVGQGELKRTGFDPLFTLNHTAAMFRANVNRLFRRTWCTTKSIDRLRDHLTIYVAFHNKMILGSLRVREKDS